MNNYRLLRTCVKGVKPMAANLEWFRLHLTVSTHPFVITENITHVQSRSCSKLKLSIKAVWVYICTVQVWLLLEITWDKAAYSCTLFWCLTAFSIGQSVNCAVVILKTVWWLFWGMICAWSSLGSWLKRAVRTGKCSQDRVDRTQAAWSRSCDNEAGGSKC